MNAYITPHRLSGIVEAIPSKSYAQRYLIASFLSEAPSTLTFENPGDDIAATIRATDALKRGERTIDCGSSATAARILNQVIAVTHPRSEITGSEQLMSRPIESLIELPARSGLYKISGSQSSQYLSGLLFALPLLEGESRIELIDTLESSGYVDMTLEVLDKYSIVIESTGQGWIVPGGQIYRAPGDLVIEGDWSSAAVWLASGVIVTGLNPATKQPDGIAFFPYCSREGAGVRMRASAQLPATIDVSQCPDLTPVLAVMAATATRYDEPKTTRITGTHRLRIKESDRIESITQMLQALGAEVTVDGDDMIIVGKKTLSGGVIEARDDHRIVMAATLASCWCEDQVTIIGADAVTKSYPRFFDDFETLGGIVELE